MKEVLKKIVKKKKEKMIGWEMIEVDVEKGKIRIEFNNEERMMKKRGKVKGGIVEEMIDDKMVKEIYEMKGGKYME